MRIDALVWDEGNEAELAAHGLAPADIEGMLEGGERLLIVRNKRQASGDYKVIGRGRGDRLITVIIAPTGEPTTWRPVTGWRSDKTESAAAKRHGV